MKTTKKDTETTNKKLHRPATNPEAQENLCISLAINLAERQLREGTASSQVITHYLKLGTEKERLENEKLKKELELVDAKTENLKSAKKADEAYVEVLKAMQLYSGVSPEGEEEDDDY